MALGEQVEDLPLPIRDEAARAVEDMCPARVPSPQDVEHVSRVAARKRHLARQDAVEGRRDRRGGGGGRGRGGGCSPPQQRRPPPPPPPARRPPPPLLAVVSARRSW